MGGNMQIFLTTVCECVGVGVGVCVGRHAYINLLINCKKKKIIRNGGKKNRKIG